MADTDQQQPPPGEAQQQNQPKPAADKAEADKAAADKTAADKAEADKAAADAEAEIERRASAKAAKMADKIAEAKLAQRAEEEKKKLDREKLDVVERAKAERTDFEQKLAAAQADAAAAGARADLASHMLSKGKTPAGDGALAHITAAYQRALGEGLEADKAFAQVMKSEPYLFAQPAAQQPKPAVDTGGRAAGASERPVSDQGGGQSQFKTPNPGDVPPTDIAGLAASIAERHRFTPVLLH